MKMCSKPQLKCLCVLFDTLGYYEKRLSTTKDGKGTESSKAHHYSQCLPAKMHSVNPEGGVSSTSNQLFLQGSFYFTKCQNQPFFAQIRAFDILQMK